MRINFILKNKLQKSIFLCMFLNLPGYSAVVSENDPPDFAASDTYPCIECRSFAYFLTLSAGPAWTKRSPDETLPLTNNVTYIYKYSNDFPKHTDPTGEIFFGLQKTIERGFRGQFGGAIAFIRDQLSGSFSQSTTPNQSGSFNYNVNGVRYAAKAKLIADIPYDLSLYFSGSAGAAVNKTSKYKIINPSIYQQAIFQDQRQNTFSYTLGVGLEREFCLHWRVGIGYEYADWGKHQLERASWQTLNYGLNAEHMYTSEIQFSLTYLL